MSFPEKPHIAYHHAQGGGRLGKVHNLFTQTVLEEEKDLQDLIHKDPELVAGYSEKQIQSSIEYVRRKIIEYLQRIIDTNAVLPPKYQAEHPAEKARLKKLQEEEKEEEKEQKEAALALMRELCKALKN